MGRAKKTSKMMLKDNILWIVQGRNGWFNWTPVAAYENKDDADAYRLYLESAAPASYRSYKTDRVEITRGLPEGAEEV